MMNTCVNEVTTVDMATANNCGRTIFNGSIPENVVPTISNVQVIGNNNLYNTVFRFMNKKKNGSDKTYNTYIKHYNDFFNFMCGKDLYSTTWEDMYSITIDKVEDYQLFLQNKGFAVSTCNQKLFAVKSLWDYLCVHNNELNKSVLEFEEIKEDDNSYASLSTNEVELLFDFARDRNKGHIQSLLFEFLYIVGCRKNVPFELKKSDIFRGYDFNAECEAWVIQFRDKGNKLIKKAISDEFYERLMGITNDFSDKVFNVSVRTVEDTFKDFRDKYDLHEKNGKKVVIHSIKKASGWSAYKMTGGDINAVKEHMQHEHIDTTSRIYLNGKDNFCSQPSFMLSKSFSINDLRDSDLSREDLLDLIEKSGQDIINRLCFLAIDIEK